MSRYVVILVIILVTVFSLSVGLYYLFAQKRHSHNKISFKSGSRGYVPIRGGSFDYTKLNQTRYKHNVSASNGHANLINQPGECKIWGSPDRIQGGRNASIGDFPCLALLEYLLNDNKYSFDCSGSLINHRYVITAAHCLHKKNLVNVRLGEFDISKNPDTDEDDVALPEPINAGIENTIIHENYSSKYRKINDIGLIRLSMDVEFQNFFIRPICIPDSSMETPAGKFVGVPGWGSTGDAKHSSVLQKIYIPIFDFIKCQQLFGDSEITQSKLCAGGEDGKDACHRDSGGPLVAIFNWRTYIEGIVSYGIGCGKKDMPGIYTRVSFYHDWILDKLQP